jgi:hypothetical protein
VEAVPSDRQRGDLVVADLDAANAESFALVQPGEGALEDPADLAQSGTVGDATSGDQRLDASLPQQAAILVEVVAPVGVQASGLRRGRTRRPRIDGTASSSGRSWVTWCRFPPVSVRASGVPWRSTLRWSYVVGGLDGPS